MTLTQAQRDAVLEHLRTKTNSACPMCGGSEWDFGPLVSVDVVGGGQAGFVLVICSRCFFTAHFPSMMFGINTLAKPAREPDPGSLS